MKEKILEIWKTLTSKKMTIRRKMLILVLACSVISILILSAIMLHGMLAIRAEAIETCQEIGELAAERSSQMLRDEKYAHLVSLAYEEADNINYELGEIKSCVEMLQRSMTRIVERPWEYSPRQIAEPKRGDGGKYMAWVFYSPLLLERQAVQEEIGLTANLQDLMIELAELIGEGESATPYVATASGFIIEADNQLPAWCFPNNSATEPATFNFMEREWFRRGRTEGKLFFTDPYFGARDGGLAISCAAPYYRNGNFAGVVGVGAALTVVSRLILDFDMGESSFCFVMDERGRILFSQKETGELAVDRTLTADLRKNKNKALSLAAKEMIENTEGVLPVKIEGSDYYMAFSPIKNTNWRFVAAVDASSVTELLNSNRALIQKATYDEIGDIDQKIRLAIFFMFLAVIIIVLAASGAGWSMSEKFAEPILELSDNVREISSGKFDKKISIKTGDEIEHLASCFNAMTDELQTYMKNLTAVTAEREKIATELNVAKDIQRGMLPHDFDFGRSDFEIFATMNAAKEVGGDFYDFYLLDENHLAITVADVSGKGIPASLFMVISKTVLKNFATFSTNPDDYAAVLSCANNQLCKGNDEMMFVTVFFGVLEIDSGRFIYVNGGHNPPVIYHRAENKCEFLAVKKNFVLGGMEDVPYKQQEIKLEAGDLIFAYTDGVNEAMNENHEEYTSERLLKFMNGTDCNAELKTLLAAVRADVALHVGKAEQSDDITMLALRRN